MLTRMREERGLAMVIAVMVTFIVLILATVVVSQAIHNSGQSGYDRQRLQSIDAAEAGTNWYYNYLQKTSLANLSISPSCTSTTQALNTSPGTASFTATVTFYKADKTVLPCNLMSQTNYPAAAYVRSVGTVDGQVPRTLETYMNLTPDYGGFSAAVIASSPTAFTNNFTITGNNGNDGDIYINTGDLTITSTPNIYGNVYVVQGAASMSNLTKITGNLWANGSVTIDNPATVTGSVMSSTSSITVSGTVGGGATAGTTIATPLGGTIGGAQYPNSPQGPPPSKTLPLVCWTDSGSCVGTASSWTAAGYTVQTFADCASARTFLTGGTITGNTVVRITAVCNLNIANNDTITFNGNLAIFTDGSVSMVNRNTWNGQGGTRNLYFIANYRSGLNCSTGSYDIATSNQSNFNSVQVSFYSPCTVTINNLNSFSGQILGGTVNLANNFTMNFKPVLIPGVGEIAGFKQDIVYIREVANS